MNVWPVNLLQTSSSHLAEKNNPWEGAGRGQMFSMARAAQGHTLSTQGTQTHGCACSPGLTVGVLLAFSWLSHSMVFFFNSKGLIVFCKT